MQETWVQSLGREDPLKKEMETHSSTLAWKIPWTEECGGLQSMGKQRARQDWATSLSLFTCLKCSLGISSFLEEISSLSQSIVFLYFFFCIGHWERLSYLSLLFFGTLHSNGCIFPFLLCFLLLFFSKLFIRPPQKTISPFCIFFPLGMVLITASCTMSQTSILQALYQI